MLAAAVLLAWNPYLLLDAGFQLSFLAVAGVAELMNYPGVYLGAASELAKIKAGASLVQLYSAFAYDGPALIPRIKRDLAGLLTRGGY